MSVLFFQMRKMNKKDSDIVYIQTNMFRAAQVTQRVLWIYSFGKLIVPIITKKYLYEASAYNFQVQM